MASPTIKEVEVGKPHPTTGKRKVRYRFVVDAGQCPKTGKRKQITKTYDGLRVAQKELARILNEVNRGTYSMPSKVTVDEYLDEWLRSATRGKEAATVRNYQDALLPVRDQLGKKVIQKVTTVDVENLVDTMLTSGRKRGGKPGTGLSPRSVQLTLSRFRSALDAAVHRRVVEFNVAAPVRCPAQIKTPRVPWSEDEVKGFLASLKGERLRPVMLLSLMGLRPAEVCGLRWSDVDLEAQTLKVGNTRTLAIVDDHLVVVEKGPKTEAGERTLPLPAPVVTALRAFRVEQAKEKLAAGPDCLRGQRLRAGGRAGSAPEDRLAAPEGAQGDGGGRGAEGAAVRRPARLLDLPVGERCAGHHRKVRLYDARHACLTYLSVNGVPDTIVSAWAGHSDLSLAKRVYVHPDVKDLEKGRDALASLLG